jgi:hypothetical protein
LIEIKAAAPHFWHQAPMMLTVTISAVMLAFTLSAAIAAMLRAAARPSLVLAPVRRIGRR